MISHSGSRDIQPFAPFFLPSRPTSPPSTVLRFLILFAWEAAKRPVLLPPPCLLFSLSLLPHSTLLDPFLYLSLFLFILLRLPFVDRKLNVQRFIVCEQRTNRFVVISRVIESERERTRSQINRVFESARNFLSAVV